MGVSKYEGNSKRSNFITETEKMTIDGINIRKRPEKCEILKGSIHETFHQLSDRENLITVEK